MTIANADKNKAVTRCTACGTSYRIQRQFLGRKIKCNKCGTAFKTAEAGSADSAPPPEGDSKVDARIGARLGPFKITGVLGQGGMGTVYEAEDTVLLRKVAVKVLPPAVVSQGKETLDRFLREARSAGSLEHPNIVSIYQVGCEGGVYFIAMQLVRGGSAADFIREHGPMTPHDATRVVIEAAKALAAAHRQGLIHRDIKPANILLGPEWTVKVADFGLAKTQDSNITSPGGVMGTPSYLSPEACRGENVDSRSDLYSLGATYYCLLTGRPPFQGENTPAIMFKHVYEPVPDPRAERPNIPAGCVDVLMRALAKDVADRYQTAEEMIADLSALDFSATPGYDDGLENWAALAAAAQTELSGELPQMERTATATATVGLLTQPTVMAPVGGSTVGRGGRTLVRRGVRPWHLLIGAAAGAVTLAAIITWAAINSSRRTEPPEKKDDDVGRIPDAPPQTPPRVEPPVGGAAGDDDLDAIPALPEVSPALVAEFRRLAEAATEARAAGRDKEAFIDAVKQMQALAERFKTSASVKTREYAANVESYARDLAASLDAKDLAAVPIKPPEAIAAPAGPWLARFARDKDGFYSVFDGGKPMSLLAQGKSRDWKVEGNTIIGEGRPRPLSLSPLLGSRYFEMTFQMKWLASDAQTRGGVGYWLAPFHKESGCRINLTPTARWWERNGDEAGRVYSGAPLPDDWVHVRVVVRHDKEHNRDVHEVWMRPAGAAREAKIIAAHSPDSDAPTAGLGFFCEGGRLALREIKVRPESRAVGGGFGRR